MVKKRTAHELKLRIAAAKAIISTLKNDPDFSDDPRTPGTIKHYRAQQLKLEKELWTVEEPQPVQIGLQPGKLTAKSLNTKE